MNIKKRWQRFRVWMDQPLPKPRIRPHHFKPMHWIQVLADRRQRDVESLVTQGPEVYMKMRKAEILGSVGVLTCLVLSELFETWWSFICYLVVCGWIGWNGSNRSDRAEAYRRGWTDGRFRLINNRVKHNSEIDLYNEEILYDCVVVWGMPSEKAPQIGKDPS